MRKITIHLLASVIVTVIVYLLFSFTQLNWAWFNTIGQGGRAGAAFIWLMFMLSANLTVAIMKINR